MMYLDEIKPEMRLRIVENINGTIITIEGVVEGVRVYPGQGEDHLDLYEIDFDGYHTSYDEDSNIIIEKL